MIITLGISENSPGQVWDYIFQCNKYCSFKIKTDEKGFFKSVVPFEISSPTSSGY